MAVENLVFLTKPTQSQKLSLLTLIITIYVDRPYVYFGKLKLKSIFKQKYFIEMKGVVLKLFELYLKKKKKSRTCITEIHTELTTKILKLAYQKAQLEPIFF